MIDDHRAYEFDCPACFSKAGQKCTEATDTGRKPVAYIHHARTALVQDK